MKTNVKIFLLSFSSGIVGAFFLFMAMFVVYSNRSNQMYQQSREEILPVHRMNEFYQMTPGALSDFTYSSSLSVPAVVHIQTLTIRRGNDFFSPFFDFFGGSWVYEYPVTGAGSGVIIREDGYIVTNHHVIAGAEQISVTLNDKREYQAKLLGYDPATDLALLKIEDKDLPFLVFGDSDLLKVGEWVLAVGNPFNLTSTVTAGIVSAKARNIGVNSGNNAIESFIQTDAAVNRGNSGGALVNLQGELVGINTAIASSTGY